MRSFFGLVNQVSFAFSMKDTMAPFRQLLRPSAEFHWDAKLHELFEEVREEVVKKVEAGVKMFEMDRVTCLATDWSKEGVGFFMLQKYCKCQDGYKDGMLQGGLADCPCWLQILKTE